MLKFGVSSTALAGSNSVCVWASEQQGYTAQPNVTDELERIWKEASLKNLGIVAKFASRDSEKLLKTSVRITLCPSRDSNGALPEYKRTAIQLGCLVRKSSRPHFNLSRVWVTIDGLCIDDQIYCILWYIAWLHFTIHYYTRTNIHSYIFTVVAWQRLQRRSFSLLWVPELSPASASSFSQQQLTTELQQSSNSLLTCPAYKISARTA
jgi:hypothetical protein